MLTAKEENKIKETLTHAHDAYEKALNTRAFFKVNDHALGEDLVQDTFIKTWSYLVRGGKIDMMKAFLYHVLNNLIIDEYRKHKTVSLDLMVEKGIEPRDEKSERLFDILDGKNAMLLIKQLPEKYRGIMKMKYVQDLSLKEMSILTGKTKATIAVQAHRGLEKLKLLYKAIQVIK